MTSTQKDMQARLERLERRDRERDNLMHTFQAEIEALGAMVRNVIAGGASFVAATEDARRAHAAVAQRAELLMRDREAA
jgi:hypothetical protein